MARQPAMRQPPGSPDRSQNQNLILAIIILVPVGVRLFLATILGLSYDETYVAAMSHHLNAGYVDHPPLAMFLSALSQTLTGSISNVAVRLSSIVLFAGTTWIIYQLGTLLAGARAGLYAAAALSLTPLFSVYLGVLNVTDAPMLFAVAAAVYCFCRALMPRAPIAWWIATGVFVGLALLSKYSAVLVFLGFPLFLVTSPAHRKWLLSPWPYLAAAFACFVCLPIIVWNAQHDWVSLQFQGSRAVGLGFNIPGVLKYVSVQILTIFPGMWLLLWFGALRAIRSRRENDLGWLLLCCALVPIAVFTLLRLLAGSEKAGFHWVAPGYLLLYPLAGKILAEWPAHQWRWIRASAFATIAALVLVVAIISIHTLTNWTKPIWTSFAKTDPLAWDTVNWHEIDDVFARERAAGSASFAVGLDWEECVKVDWGLKTRVPLLCITPNALQYPLLFDQRDHVGKDGLIFTRRKVDELLPLTRYFEAIDVLSPVTITQFGKPIVELTVLRGRGLKAQSQ